MSASAPSSDAAASTIADMRRIVADQFQPKMALYFLDATVTGAIGGIAFTAAVAAPLFSWPQVLGFLIAGPALYRLGSFVHEIVHMKKGEHVAFKVYWHIIAGIPMFLPSYLYENHIGHHNTRVYGTRQDAEYLPLGGSPAGYLWRVTGHILLVPLLVVLRFGVLVPLSLMSRRLRLWMLRCVSAYGIHLHYRRPIPDDAPHRLWLAIDLLVFLRLLLLVYSLTIPPNWLLVLAIMYLLAVYALGLNWLRTLGAHRFESNGAPIDFDAQLSDSVTVTGVPVLTELMCPLGMRYHALHHLFPAMPYHRLGRAHRKLVAQLPADAPYCRTIRPSVLASVAALCRATRRDRPARPAAWREGTASPDR